MLDPALLEPLREVIDPELGINIVDLGLVYEAVRQGDVARVEMTMTTPACPLGDFISAEVRRALTRALPELREIDVAIVYAPPWSPARMSEAAREQLGWPTDA